jgi:hypothetical protein
MFMLETKVWMKAQQVLVPSVCMREWIYMFVCVRIKLINTWDEFYLLYDNNSADKRANRNKEQSYCHSKLIIIMKEKNF